LKVTVDTAGIVPAKLGGVVGVWKQANVPDGASRRVLQVI
jgi:hypothetical protein